jgi:hypothetical protein
MEGGLMAIEIRRRAGRSEDRAGDPFEGLVNLFELGVVLAVGFMLAALASMDLESDLTGKEDPAPPEVEVRSDKPIDTVEMTGRNYQGEGTPLGRAYVLDDGRTVIVRDP